MPEKFFLHISHTPRSSFQKYMINYWHAYPNLLSHHCQASCCAPPTIIILCLLTFSTRFLIRKPLHLPLPQHHPPSLNISPILFPVFMLPLPVVVAVAIEQVENYMPWPKAVHCAEWNRALLRNEPFLFSSLSFYLNTWHSFQLHYFFHTGFCCVAYDSTDISEKWHIMGAAAAWHPWQLTTQQTNMHCSA